ncbi:MAG: pitrilysin family protein [bacterium]|jgi:predicted Zn-dependent peptidase|nr:MAG: insulinase family protein [bacterium]
MILRETPSPAGRQTAPGRWPAMRAACALVAACIALAPRPASAQYGQDLPVVERMLPNGLRLLALRREGAPTVAFVMQYRVGAVQERDGETGIAHLLEHMLFKGTTTIGTRDHAAELELFARIDAIQDSIVALRAERADASAPARSRGTASCGPSAEEPPEDPRIQRLAARLKALEDSARAFVVANEFDRILTRHGARGLNASTTYEATTYYVELPANRARLWFALEADRLRNPVMREFYAERDVVAEERRMRVESDPGGRLWECFMATAYTVHPYGRPVVGTMQDIQNFTRRQAEEYFRRYYGPNNAVVAVVGDIEPDSILAWGERYLGTIPAGEPARRVEVREPEQRGERRVSIEFDAEPQLLMGWHIPEPDHPDYPALTVLAHILTGGTTSRLHRRMVLEERVAVVVSASIQPGGMDPQLLVIGAAPAEGHTTAELERLIDEEIARLQTDPPDTLELGRIHNQLEAGEIRRLRSNLGLAFQLAGSASAYDGDWRATFRFTERLLAVEAADVQRVARTYLRPENRTVAVLVSTKRQSEERRER